MRGLMCFLSAGAVLCAHGVSAQMQPHKAEYILRLGAAANAPRIGTATEDLTLTCDGWHLKRDVKGEVPISTALKFNVASSLDSEERRSGDVLHYRSLQVQNGAEREVRGRVQRLGEEMRADIVSPDGPVQVLLPAPTLMPVASINHIIDRLRAGSSAFPTLTFDAQVIGDAFRVDVARTDDNAIRRRPPADKPMTVPGPSWPVLMSFRRGSAHGQKPLFTFSARLFESGVLDRVTVDADLVTVTADLQTLELRSPPSCR